MTEKPPRRFKRMEELTVGEILEQQRTGAQVETDEFRAYRRQVLEAAGTEGEPEREAKTAEDKTAADFDREISEAHP